uniref:Prefoldin subunit 1 n=2 Tax=Pan TaxID=9596 RepID=A0A2I3TGP1_PANTR
SDPNQVTFPLQASVFPYVRQVKLVIEQLNRTKKHAHLTDTEIMTLVDETNMYEGVGRMFILQSKEAIHNQLLEKQQIKKSYLERSVKEAENNIREMLMARRAQ